MHNMSFFTILETLLIGPLKLLFEIIFTIANQFIGHPGLSIIVLSLVMNILVLPLYRRADAMQEESRDTEAKLREGVAHIKKTFSGDERMMILQTYYRQNHYRPTDALNGSVSLLLEIPFFMAAYQFLSHVQILNGVSLGPIRDLGAPDGLLVDRQPDHQPPADPDDGHQLCLQRHLPEGLSSENQAPALRHGPVLPGFPVHLPGLPRLLLDAEQPVLPGKDHFLQAEKPPEDPGVPDFRPWPGSPGFRPVLLSYPLREA